jgi:hypothetical protein
MSGLILGRSPNLWLGAFVAVWNVAALVFHFDQTLTSGVDAAAGAVILLIAGTDTIQIAAGNAAQARQAPK